MAVCFRQVWGSAMNDREYYMLPRHAWLQNMTYSAKIKSEKFKTGEEQCLDKQIVTTESRDVFIGKLPVMVKSDLCWLKDERADCEFDHGGYFIIKGAEKTFIAQEQTCLKRLLITSNQGLTVAYRSDVKQHRLIIRLSGISQLENIEGLEKVLSVYFMSAEIPVWIWFFALGVSSDNEVIDLIDYGKEDASISNILVASILDADQRKDIFRRGKNALRYVEEMIKNTTFPPWESIEECISMYLFPNLRGMK
ncbi:putative DNA-directed RNA polymerase [Rosa chinensis]|uniref:DNA-directed RNA polymerase n=1 Tax=Rosa chinensis TaxID=74649 RepID=A0A2P6QD13_ROSCH|nr:putative DNA-directed RNA polymerase [Rosa chinensis]